MWALGTDRWELAGDITKTCLRFISSCGILDIRDNWRARIHEVLGGGGGG